MKRAGAPFVILLLLAVAACGRQPGAASGNGAEDAAVISGGAGRTSVDHDPRAMTAIDVATGDLSGFANYAGGRAWAPQPYHTASSEQPPGPAPVSASPVAAAPSDMSPSAMPLVVPPPTDNTTTGVPPASTGQPTP